MADQITNINQGIIGYFSSMDFLNLIYWVIFALIVVGVCLYAFVYWRNKKTFSKKITAFEIVGVNFVPTFRDLAKVVKIGTGGFEILYLKKLKTWKIGYGGRVGKSDYYFFIMIDGYWYNGMLSANLYKIDELGGLIPITTTNPSMRSQYTALEKQIDALHANKKGFWEQYGNFMLSIAFVVIASLMLWLNYKEFVQVSSNFNAAVDKLVAFMERMPTATSGGSGLVPAK